MKQGLIWCIRSQSNFNLYFTGIQSTTHLNKRDFEVQVEHWELSTLRPAILKERKQTKRKKGKERKERKGKERKGKERGKKKRKNEKMKEIKIK